MALLAEFVAGETSQIDELWNQKSASRPLLFTDASCDVGAAGSVIAWIDAISESTAGKRAPHRRRL